MKRMKFLSLLLALSLMFTGCGGPETSSTASPLPTETPAATPAPTPTPGPTPSPTPDPREEIRTRVAAMTDEELAGQVLVVGIEGTKPGPDAHAVIEELHAGGIILFSRNVESAGQLAELTNELKAINQAAGNQPVFLCVDEEGGMVSRMPGEVADLPSAYDYAQAGGDPYARGEALAAECKAFGFHVDFAPVMDVWSNPNNTVIGKRAFASDAETAALFGQRTADRISYEGVIPVGKHFPGHGDTETDSHVGLPVVDKSLEELRACELYPFQYAFGDHLAAVMVGHILLRQIDPLLPSSLSPKVVDGLLREELGFEGVVFTDDLTMGAVSQGYDLPEAVVLSIQAGCDMALICHKEENARSAHEAILTALEEGTLTRQRLEESACRILSLKAAYGVDDSPVGEPNVEELNEVIRSILP
ncbi:MAG: beta-N-acetylhexosaminidase [Oscillospiraceae bacterium]|nr:beta-N-acetylhexosaminidase [Oscillospiraceae bacterium]